METKHPALKDKPLEIFQEKVWTWTEAIVRGITTSSNVSALRASFLVANCITEAKKPFPVGEGVDLLAAWDICHELLEETAIHKMARVPPLASTITRQTDEIAEDIES